MFYLHPKPSLKWCVRVTAHLKDVLAGEIYFVCNEQCANDSRWKIIRLYLCLPVKLFIALSNKLPHPRPPSRKLSLKLHKINCTSFCYCHSTKFNFALHLKLIFSTNIFPHNFLMSVCDLQHASLLLSDCYVAFIGAMRNTSTVFWFYGYDIKLQFYLFIM